MSQPKYLFAAITVALGFASPAQAAEWWWVSFTGDRPERRVEFLDKESATTDYSGRVSAWTFVIYEKPRSNGVRKVKALSRYDCRNRTITLLELIQIGNNDRLINSFTYKSYEQEEKNVVPESIGEANWQFVCQGKIDVNDPVAGAPEEFAAFLFKEM